MIPNSIKSFLDFKKSCPVCDSPLSLKDGILPFHQITLCQNVAQITILESKIQYTTSIDILSNIVIQKPDQNPNKYINGHIHVSCSSCKQYQYRSNYIEYDFYASKFSPLEPDQEIYYGKDVSIISYFPSNRTIIYYLNAHSNKIENVKLPFLPLSLFDLHDEFLILAKVKKILIML